MRPQMLISLGLLAGVAPLAGQETAQRSTLAVGVRLGNDRLLQTGDFLIDPGAATIASVVPVISVALGGARRGWLWEPSLGYWRRNDDITFVQLGLALERHFTAAEMSPFVGIRWTVHARSSDALENPLDNVVAVLFGGDYFLAERFTIGGEVSLNHAFLEELIPPRNDITYTDAALRFRFHLR